MQTDIANRFVTVHDLDLTPDEFRIWGGLPRTPDDYPRIDSESPMSHRPKHEGGFSGGVG